MKVKFLLSRRVAEYAEGSYFIDVFLRSHFLCVNELLAEVKNAESWLSQKSHKSQFRQFNHSTPDTLMLLIFLPLHLL